MYNQLKIKQNQIHNTRCDTTVTWRNIFVAIEFFKLETEESDDNVIAQLLDEEGGNRWWVIEKINARRHG